MLPPAETIHFIKMQSLGNDFILIQGQAHSWAKKVLQLADRRLGVGCDQVLFLSPHETGWRLAFYNADGSEAEACGNGTRCGVGWIAQQGEGAPLRPVNVLTRGGEVRGWLTPGGEAAVEQPRPFFLFSTPLSLSSWGLGEGWAVSVGNPHLVIFVEELASVPVTLLGPQLEKHPAFAQGVNVHFVEKVGASRLKIRTWERGAGATPACGTGACASAFVVVSQRREGAREEEARGEAAKGGGVAPPHGPFSVLTEGGTLTITFTPQGSLVHTAPFQKVFEGQGAF
jgi:diaminopimelate epimerase